MDRETANDILALIDSKIKRLQASREQIVALIGKDEDSLGKSRAISGTTKKVHEIMMSLNRPISPSDLFEQLKKNGIEISDSRVRQILMRWKGRLFKSEKRGLWLAIKEN